MVKNSPSGTEAMNADCFLRKHKKAGLSKEIRENNVKDSVSMAQVKKGGESPSVFPF